MSTKKRKGKREREARKRFKGGRTVVSFHNGSEWLTLKLGRKKHAEDYRKENLPF